MTPFCIPSTMVSWRGMSHRSSLCLHAVVFTQSGIKLNKSSLKTCLEKSHRALMLTLGISKATAKKVWDFGRNVDECWNSFPPFLHLHLLISPAPCLSLLQIPVHRFYRGCHPRLWHKSFRVVNAHKALFISCLNARCHIRGSGACAILAERQ